MGEIIRFEGAALADLLDRFEDLSSGADTNGITSIEVCVDGGLKLKVNGSTWTPPLGTVK